MATLKANWPPVILASSIFLALTWLTAGEALGRAMPVVVYTLLTLLALSAIVTALVYCVVRIETARTHKAELQRDRTLAKLEGAREALNLLANTALTTAALEQVQQGMIYPANLNERKFTSFPASVLPAPQSAIPLLAAPSLPLLSAIRDMPNLLIVGGKNSGKTTLLQWLERERLQNGQTIVLDSHATPGQWSGRSIGAGREYAMIKNAMLALIEKMDRRHKARTAGTTHFEPIHTIIDEFTLLPGYLKNAGYRIQDYSFPMLTEGRKAGMSCLWGIHSDRAKPLGFEGAADLKECFDCIIYLKEVKRERYALVNFGEGIEAQRYSLPGPFYMPAPDRSAATVPPQSQPDTIVISAAPEPDNTLTDEEATAIEAFTTLRDSAEKFSMNKAVKGAFGADKTGAFYHKKLKRILDKFKIDYSELV